MSMYKKSPALCKGDYYQLGLSNTLPFMTFIASGIYNFGTFIPQCVGDSYMYPGTNNGPLVYMYLVCKLHSSFSYASGVYNFGTYYHSVYVQFGKHVLLLYILFWVICFAMHNRDLMVCMCAGGCTVISL